MSANRSGRAPLLSVLLIAAVIGLAALWMITRESGSTLPEEPRGEDRGATTEAPGPPTRDPVESPAGDRDRDLSTRRESPPPPLPTSTLLCLHHTESRPLAGIQLWAGEQSLVGPSGADGVLSFEATLPSVVTVWGEGWTPLELRGRELPDRALLVPANGGLEVRLNNRQLEHRVARFLLQSRTPSSAPEGPWKPTLVKLGDDRYMAEKLPAGEYDVYFWVSVDRSAPRPLAARQVKVEPGKRTEIDFDLESVNKPEPEVD